jgi:EmrB/QacA subfamily drug resistance transporter
MKKPFWTYLACCIAVFMISMDNLIVTNALPVIRQALHTGLEGLEWTVNAYTLTFAVLLLTGAALGDRFGRRRLMTIGITVFTAGSAASALAPGIGALIAARAVQGVGAAIVMPLTVTLIASVTSPQRRGMALGIWGATAGLGAALGPVIGGAITDAASWQWIFWINVPIGIVVLPLLLLARESRSGAGRLDPVGVVLATAGLFGIVFGLVRGNGHGWTSAQVLVSLVGGGILVAAFVVWEARTAAPMMPLSLFRNDGFAAASTTMLLTTMGMFGVIFLVSQFMQSVLGYTPLAAGVHGLPWTAAPAITAPIAGLLSDRVGGRRIVAIGVALQAIGIGWLAHVITPTIPYADLVPPFLIAGAGLGFFFAPITQLTLRYAPGELEGIASGTSNALRQVGTVLGIAVLGSVFSATGGLDSPVQFTAGLTNALGVSAAILAVAALVVILAPETQGLRPVKVPAPRRDHPVQLEGYRPSPSPAGSPSSPSSSPSRMAHRR